MPFPVYSRKYESECHSQPITKSAELRDLQGSIGYQGHSCPITLAYGIPRFPTPPLFRSISFGWEQVGKTKYPSIIKGIVDHQFRTVLEGFPCDDRHPLLETNHLFGWIGKPPKWPLKFAVGDSKAGHGPKIAPEDNISTPLHLLTNLRILPRRT